MSRRRRESTAEMLFELPWWVSAGLAAFVFIGLKWVLPAMWASSQNLKAVAGVFSGMAWFPTGALLIVAALAFIRERVAAAKASSRESAVAAVGAPISRPSRPRVSPAPMRARAERREPAEIDETGSGDGDAPPPFSTSEWSLELLRAIEWKRFEDLCQRFYVIKGIRAAPTPLGPDGGVDLRLYQDDGGKPTAVVQCKAWGEKFVGVKPVRELLGVMTHEDIGKGFFMTSSRFSDDAKTFAAENRITLIDGPMLLTMFARLSGEQSKALLAFATAGDFMTPTCPSCGRRMRRVEGIEGKPDFWGCADYPRCRQKLGMRGARG